MRLKIVRAKAAVFPVPDWDWAIMLRGLSIPIPNCFVFG